jgi:hypothetical protein
MLGVCGNLLSALEAHRLSGQEGMCVAGIHVLLEGAVLTT